MGSKAAEKKKERLEMQKRVDARIKFVNAANKQEDPLGALPSFKTFSKNGVKWSLASRRVTDLDEDEKKAVVDLLIRNMKAFYEKKKGGGKKKKKKKKKKK